MNGTGEAAGSVGRERRGQLRPATAAKKFDLHFPQNRVTDHRIGLTLHQLTDVNGRKAGSNGGGLTLTTNPSA